MREELDTQIVLGDGTTEPEGIFNQTGIVTVAFGSVAPTVGGYEQLLFGVTKQQKKGYDPSRIAFVSNETSYRRMKAIPVSGSDERRVFGEGFMGTSGYETYSLMGHPYKIVAAMANTQIAFANFARYRLYRRLGQQMRMSTEGATNIRSNVLLLMTRSRWGGQLEEGASAAVTTTAQS